MKEKNLLNKQEIEQFSFNEPDSAKMILVHMSPEEVANLDQMQGFVQLVNFKDEEGKITQVHSFEGLERLFAIPEFRQIFVQVAERIAEMSPDQKRELEDVNANIKASGEKVPTPSFKVDQSSIADKAASAGLGGDKDLAYIPLGIANFFDLVRGETKINPVTGLRQYFGFLVPLLASTIASAFASSAGAGLVGMLAAGAVGGGGASALFNKGKRGKNFLKGSLIGAGNVLGGHLLGSLAPSLGSAPSLGGKLMDGVSKGFGALSSLGSAGEGAARGSSFFNAGQRLMPPSGVTPGAIPGFMKAGEAISAAPTSAISAGGGGSYGLGSLGKSILGSPLTPMLAMGYLLRKGEKDTERKYQQEKDEARRKSMAFKEAMGEYDVLQPRIREPHTFYRDYNPEDEIGGYQRRWGASYKKGGKVEKDKPLANKDDLVSVGKSHIIKGAGKGQEDRIRAQNEEGDWIVDAATTSMAGDGSSEAGGKQLDRFVNLIENSLHKLAGKKPVDKIMKEVHSPKSLTPTALSNDEYKINHKVVTILGSGDNQLGNRILKNWRENFRKHKSSNGHNLPPKAYKLEYYLPKTIQKKIIAGS